MGRTKLTSRRRANPLLAVLFVLLSLGGGYAIYRASHAATGSSVGWFATTVVDQFGRAVPGADVVIAQSGATTNCVWNGVNQNKGTTDGSGNVTIPCFWSGTSNQAFLFRGAYKAGYGSYSPPSETVFWMSPNKTVTLGQPVVLQYNIPSGCGDYTLNDQCDNDGDGIYNQNDHCVNSPGPAANNGCPWNKPTAAISASKTSIGYNESTTISWSSSDASSCSFKSGTGNPGNVGTSGGPWTTPKLTSSTTYSITCSGNGGTSSLVSVGISVAGAPPPPPPNNPTPPTTPTKPNPGTGTKTQSVAKPAAGAAADTTPPSAPDSLKATQDSPGSIDLTWGASTDNVAVVGYSVERSTDQSTWTKLADTISDTSYSDSDITFGTHYYYRVYALDAAKNTSNSSLVDITAQGFKANVTKGSDAQITSEDGVVTVNIPAGAVDNDAYCEIVPDDNDREALPKQPSTLAGPYMLNCKDSSSHEITKFNKPLEFLVNLQAKGKSLKLYLFDSGQWGDSKQKASSKSPNFKFSTDTPQPLAVLGTSTGGSLWLTVIIIIIVLALLGAGFYFWRRRSSQGVDYDSFIQSQYVAPAKKASEDSPIDAVPTPAAPTPGTSTVKHGPGVTVGQLAAELAAEQAVKNTSPKAPHKPVPAPNPTNNPNVAPETPKTEK